MLAYRYNVTPTKDARPVPIPIIQEKNPKHVGVIDCIIEVISRESGGTVDEIVAILRKKFPHRDPRGMRATAAKRANRYATHKDRDEKRGGIVYFKR